MRSLRIGPLLALALVLVACDDGPSGPRQGDSTVVGRVEDDGNPSTALAPTESATPSGPGHQVQGSVHTVAIGQLSSGGEFIEYAEAQVGASGDFRLIGVPAGREDLLIRAYDSTGAEIGSVILHETTEAGSEHVAHPISARSTVHARVWAYMRTEQSPAAMDPPELALFLRFQSEAAAAAALGAAEIQAIAEAAMEAQTTIGAVLAAQGHSTTARARSALLRGAVAVRDHQRDVGVAVETAHENFVRAATDAYLDAGVTSEAIVTAYAAGVSAFARSLAQSAAGAQTQADLVRDGILLTAYARARAAERESGVTLGLRNATIQTMAQLEVRVEAAATLAEIRAEVDEERSEIEDYTVGLVLTALTAVGGSADATVEAELRSAIGNANLWSDLEASVTASTAVQSVAEFRARVESEIEGFLATLPPEIEALLSAGVMARLGVCLGAGAYVG